MLSAPPSDEDGLGKKSEQPREHHASLCSLPCLHDIGALCYLTTVCTECRRSMQQNQAFGCAYTTGGASFVCVCVCVEQIRTYQGCC